MSGYFNPYTGSYSWEQDLKDHPECKAKILAIVKRLNLQTLLTHEEIRALCAKWGCVTAAETWKKIDSLSNEELGKDVSAIMDKRKKRAKALESYLVTQGVLEAEAAGVA